MIVKLNSFTFLGIEISVRLKVIARFVREDWISTDNTVKDWDQINFRGLIRCYIKEFELQKWYLFNFTSLFDFDRVILES